MPKNKILNFVIAIGISIAAGVYLRYSANQLAQEAAVEICDCLERNQTESLSDKVGLSACLNILNQDGFRSVKKKLLEQQMKEQCPELSNKVEIVEQSWFN